MPLPAPFVCGVFAGALVGILLAALVVPGDRTDGEEPWR